MLLSRGSCTTSGRAWSATGAAWLLAGGWLSWAGACIVTCLTFGIERVFKPVALLVAIVWAADVLGPVGGPDGVRHSQGSRVASPSTSASGSISRFLPPSRRRSGGGSWSLATTLGAAIGGGLTALAITVGLGLAIGGGGNEVSRNRDSRRRCSMSGGENSQMCGALPSG
ncbi:hypothetical protein CHLRE_12g499601v5 [Chlamydomonas reinhardtii]|uniref:Uncharacterized protein n=1 Tax=Chlamydomonas reinhardtii TaxID=3055 RepID=A0A2K3D3D2_CHLRE|nr:uncharacterized protein CHLRE_12g499601v5 [Chlamydomonas reinhardtii]PNW75027.1 hypothetical protein CHLRE_12g499601v5 [Chlamydomonas reinhardtii]